MLILGFINDRVSNSWNNYDVKNHGTSRKKFSTSTSDALVCAIVNKKFVAPDGR